MLQPRMNTDRHGFSGDGRVQAAPGRWSGLGPVHSRLQNNNGGARLRGAQTVSPLVLQRAGAHQGIDGLTGIYDAAQTSTMRIWRQTSQSLVSDLNVRPLHMTPILQLIFGAFIPLPPDGRFSERTPFGAIAVYGVGCILTLVLMYALIRKMRREKRRRRESKRTRQ